MTDVMNSSHASPSNEATVQPKMKVHQETFTFMNQQPVYVQITEMEQSAWVWVSSAATILSQAQLMGGAQEAGSGGSGAFGDFAIGMPAYRSIQASSTTLLGNAMEDAAAGMARRLATRFKMQVLVNLDLPVHADNGVLLAFAEKKVSEKLKAITESNATNPSA
ncbi:hypothetical protein BGW41_006420 [Actinomortierella wolfii]|nr:hypothetical protein BGW41_006420 [Actinomortierella wolfii]